MLQQNFVCASTAYNAEDEEASISSTKSFKSTTMMLTTTTMMMMVITLMISLHQKISNKKKTSISEC